MQVKDTGIDGVAEVLSLPESPLQDAAVPDRETSPERPHEVEGGGGRVTGGGGASAAARDGGRSQDAGDAAGEEAGRQPCS